MTDSSLTVLVGMSMHPDAYAQLEAVAQVKTLPAETDELRVALHAADAIVCYSPSFDPALLSHAPHLKSIACHACSELMRTEARKRGIRVTLVPSLWDTVADHTIALIFATARNVAQAHHALRTGAWNGSSDLKIRYSGHDIFGKTLGIVGLGQIGSIVAKRMRGFDMRMLYADTVAKPELEQLLPFERVSLDTLFEQADIVVVTIPLNDETRGSIGAAHLCRMKKDAILVNIARGAIIDEPTLIQALQEKWIAGAGLDVFAQEPLPAEHPLLKLDNVVLTPHLGGSTKECGGVLVEDTLRILRGEEPVYPID